MSEALPIEFDQAEPAVADPPPLHAVPGGNEPARPGAVVTRSKVSLVVPTLNEGPNIEWVLRRLPDVIDEVVLVDGNSTDDTVSNAKSVRPDIVVVMQTGRGKGDALRAGFDAASGEIIIMIDADGSMEPAEIVSFVAMLENGHEFVKGSRYMDGGGSSDITWLRSTGNRVLMGMVNVLFGARFTDLCYGYCGFRRAALRRLVLDADGFEIETQIVARALKAKLHIGEVPSFESERLNGESNLNTFRDGQRVLRTLLRERLTGMPQPADGLAVDRPLPAATS